MIGQFRGNTELVSHLFSGKERRFRKSGVVALAVASSALLLAACGSSSGAVSSTSTTAKTVQTTAAQGPIKIGMITSLTGPYTPLGTNDKLGAEQEVAAINSAGGINGRQIDLVVEDDQTNPTQAVVDFKTLQSDGVVAVVGPVFSSSCMAIISGVESAKIPTIDTCADDAQVTPVRQYVFMTPPTTLIVGQQLLAYMKYKGLTKMAVAYDTTAFGESGWSEMKSLASQYGVSFVYNGSFSATATTFTSILTAVKSSGAQGLMVWGAGPAEVGLTSQFKSMGLTIPLLFSHAEASTLYTKPAGAAGNGVIIGSSIGGIGPSLPSAYPGRSIITDFANTFQKNNGYYPPEFGFDAGGAIAMIAKAIQANGATPQGIDTSLNHMTITTGDGTYNFTPTDHSGLSVNQVAIARDTNGTLVPTAFTKAMVAKAS
ncbi:MAG: ABC transporter substrate-binding protein [Acidimicrobiaceae bacterium]|nr:ABC transporter substrate-binding protein [Acidimicrobiaceae bacterium]